MDWWIDFLKVEGRSKDKKIFLQWENNEISIDECIYQFKINNDVPLSYIVDIERLNCG